MTTIAAKIICDSLGGESRLTTIEATYPRCIHAEFMTHRVFARNAASSRAIPFEKQVAITLDDPFRPIDWQVEAGGMQGQEGLPPELAELAYEEWDNALHYIAETAERIRNIGKTYNKEVDKRNETRNLMSQHPEQGWEEQHPEWNDTLIHKTMPNRLLEPWSHITVIMTATEWDGFFQQRCHPDAEIHMEALANAIHQAKERSEPHTLRPGDWHLPYVQNAPDADQLFVEAVRTTVPELLQKISTARCARVSYLTHDGTRDYSKDVELCERLKQGSGFGHRSPFEHVVQYDPDSKGSGNLRGPWVQYRKQVFNEGPG